VAGPIGEAQRQTLEAVHDAYDMNAHFTHGSPQSKALTDEAIDAFGIAGPASYVVDRLQELASLGLTRFFLQGAGIGADPEEAGAANKRLVEQVLPRLL
jgi:hypothetical protein